MKDHYKLLPQFASWILPRLEEYTRYTFQLLPQFEIPLMESLKKMPEADLFQLSLEGNKKFFDEVSRGVAREAGFKNTDDFYEDMNPIIRRHELSVEDVVRIYQIREMAVSHFTREFTGDLNKALTVIEELRDLHAALEEYTFKSFIRFKNLELNVNNQILEDAQKQAMIGSYYYHMQTGKIHWSPQMYEIFEVPEDITLSADLVIGYIVPELREVVKENHQLRLQEKQTSFTTEYPIVSGRGNRKYLAGRGRVHYSEDGTPIEMRGIFQDITETHNAIRELERSQYVLSEAQSIARIGSWEYITEENVFRCTREFYRLHGIPQDELITPESFFRLMHPEDRKRQEKVFSDALRKKGGFQEEYRIINRDGKLIWMQAQAKVVIGLSSGVVEKIYGTAQDITERIDAFETLRKNREKLADAQHIARIGSWEFNPENGETEWTDEHYVIYELPVGTQVDNSVILERIHEEDMELVMAAYREAIEKGIGYSIRYRLVFPGGKIKWVSSTCHVDFNDRLKKPVRVFGTSQDITDLVEKEIQLQKLNAELEQRVEERTQDLLESNENLQHFAYIVSHDLKAPLRAIANIVNFIQTDYKDVLDEQGKEYLRLLDERSRFMESLIQNILEYSRAGGKKEDPVDIDLRELVKQVTNDLHSDNNIDFQFNGLPVINARYTPIFQVFQNLVTNAARHVDPETGVVEIGYREEAKHVVFWVRDNGSGIDPNHFEKIFKIFQTLGGAQAGSGIGLAIVKKLMGILGGDVWVESEPGKGATFFFTLPSEVLLQEKQEQNS